MKTPKFEQLIPKNRNNSEIRDAEKVRSETALCEFTSMRARAKDDPMQLYGQVLSEIRNYFLKREITCVSGQMESLQAAVEAVLTAKLGTVTVAALAPGGGKSTLLRAVMKVFAAAFADIKNPVSEKLGGVILVVEKSAEAHEYEEVCNQAAGRKVALVVESANDYNLKRGGCIHAASRYEECPRSRCPDYDVCLLMQSVKRIRETPILIMLHARYQRHMEDMTPFMEWDDEGGQVRHRTLLLVDELPPIVESNAIDLSVLNNAENELDQRKPSYNFETQREKQGLLWLWNSMVKRPFQKLTKVMSAQYGKYKLVDRETFREAGFDAESLSDLKCKLMLYADETNAEKVVDTLLFDDHAYLAIGQTITLSLPRLKVLVGEGQPATVIFSGTATLSPEVTLNPDIAILPDLMEESYARLKIVIQRGDDFGVSRTSMRRSGNTRAMIEWLRGILAALRQRHEKILVVTYKQYADTLWEQLHEYHDCLVPYIDADGVKQNKLPYFGGVNGSNCYQEATCLVCAGLNRFDSQDYLSRALAVDFAHEIPREFERMLSSGQSIRLDQIPSVMAAQDITLARDIVQLVYRTDLRCHGGTRSIELWLVQPPNDVVGHLLSYFKDCQIEEVKELPLSCRLAALRNQQYKGERTHGSKLMEWLLRWDGESISPDQIREQLGMTQSQFKEARKHPEVRRFFQTYVQKMGSGAATKYQFRNDCARIV